MDETQVTETEEDAGVGFLIVENTPSVAAEPIKDSELTLELQLLAIMLGLNESSGSDDSDESGEEAPIEGEFDLVLDGSSEDQTEYLLTKAKEFREKFKAYQDSSS